MSRILSDKFCINEKLPQKLQNARFKRPTNVCPLHKREGSLMNSNSEVFYL